MSIPVLVFSDEDDVLATLNTLTTTRDGIQVAVNSLCTWVVVSTAEFKKLVSDVVTMPEAAFALSCGAVAKFVALSHLWTKHNIRVLFSVGGDINSWIELIAPLPCAIRTKWSHFEKVADIDISHIYKCIVSSNNVNARALAAADPDTKTVAIKEGVWGEEDRPKISFFCSAFNTGPVKLRRVIESLFAQTYNNWEFVVVDDSKDDPETSAMLKNLASFDLRIRYLNYGHSGFIEEVKRRAADACVGEWLVEVDHDDRLDPALAATIVHIGILKPEIGVIYSDCITIAVDDQEKEYSNYLHCAFSYGHGGNMSVFKRGQWHVSALTAPANAATLSDIVGVPNHVRSFKRELYHSIGGYNFDMPVAGDFDIMVRLFISKAPWALIAHPMYYQYTNAGAVNFTNIRLDQIRALQRFVASEYRPAIDKTLETLTSMPNTYPSLLKAPTSENQVGNYERPDESALRLEYVYHNQTLYQSNRAPTAGSTIARAMSCGLSHLKGGHAKFLSQLLKKKELTIVLTVSSYTSVKALKKWLDVLKPVHDQVVILGHPESILKMLQMPGSEVAPESTTKEVAVALRDFKVWSFGLNGEYSSDAHSSWDTATPKKVLHYLANYALKLSVYTSYVLYLEASAPVYTDIPHVIDNVEAVEDISPNDVNELPVYGCVDAIAIKDKTLHGFFHARTLPELYGYWPLDGSPFTNLVKFWKGQAKILKSRTEV